MTAWGNSGHCRRHLSRHCRRAKQGQECANSGRSCARWQWRNSTRGRSPVSAARNVSEGGVASFARCALQDGMAPGLTVPDGSSERVCLIVADYDKTSGRHGSTRRPPPLYAKQSNCAISGGRPSTGRQGGAARCGLTHLSRAGAASPPIEARCRRQSFPNPKIS
jgi:hypothetical protein